VGFFIGIVDCTYICFCVYENFLQALDTYLFRIINNPVHFMFPEPAIPHRNNTGPSCQDSFADIISVDSEYGPGPAVTNCRAGDAQYSKQADER
jgi:hypothetical protein